MCTCSYTCVCVWGWWGWWQEALVVRCGLFTIVLEAKPRSSFFTLYARDKQYGKVLSKRVIRPDLLCRNPGFIEERGLEEGETGGHQLRSCRSDPSKRWKWLQLWLGQWEWREMNRLQWIYRGKVTMYRGWEWWRWEWCWFMAWVADLLVSNLLRWAKNMFWGARKIAS